MGVSEALPDLAASADALEQLHRLPADHPRRAALRDAIVEAHLPLVHSLAGRYRHLGEPLDDLVQVGTIGLINAVDRFDPERGTTLATYATPTIVGEIKRYFRDRVWAVRVPRRLQELHAKLGEARATLAQELGRQPTVREISERLGVDEACTLLVHAPDSERAAEQAAGPAVEHITCVFRLDDTALTVDVSGPRARLPEPDGYAWAVLSALVDSLESGYEDDAEGRPRTWLRLVVRAGAGQWA